MILRVRPSDNSSLRLAGLSEIKQMRYTNRTHGAQRTSLLWHPELRPLLRNPRIEFSNHRLAPLSVDLSGCVFALPQHGVSPLIDQVSHLGGVGNLLGKMGRDETDALRVSHRYVTGHDGCLSYSYRHVDAGQHHVLEGRRINIPRVYLKSFDFLNPRGIAASSLPPQPAAPARLH